MSTTENSFFIIFKFIFCSYKLFSTERTMSYSFP
nr:MAG TPA: hypothetical protein [Caudoviricetes sp.]